MAQPAVTESTREPKPAEGRGEAPERYEPTHPVRIVSSAALFDGHDAAINIMRRLMQATGAEVIHLGHNRSVEEIVDAAIQEDAQGIAVTSYQGGHMEFFTYMRQMLDERGAEHVKIYGGGGGVIVPREIDELHSRGIDRIFSPEDGRELGLQGMIDEVVRGCDFDLTKTGTVEAPFGELARQITLAELGKEVETVTGSSRRIPVVGLTGTGGAGKSSLTDELVLRFVRDFEDRKVAVLCVDPSKRKSGGALLGDRIRFNTAKHPRVFLRSLATRGARGELSGALAQVLEVVKNQNVDLIFVETAGIGQADSAVVDLTDLALYVMTSEFGAPSQLEKIEMLDFADVVVINKFTRRGSEDALRDVRKQFQRNHDLFSIAPEELPIFGTSAAHFNDRGVNALYAHLVNRLEETMELGWESGTSPGGERTTDPEQYVIPPARERYLSEIAKSCREHKAWAREQSELAAEIEALWRSIRILRGRGGEEDREDDPSWRPFGDEDLGEMEVPVAE
ncbi:MAG: cobalamin-dependent protein, partial [Thermoanaerobaculia bacterium]|nr:cobalamin-dependent protein [Thermoanaerobaculia bacterium]